MRKILHIQVLPKLSGVQKISLEIFRGLPNSEYDKYILFSESTEKGDLQECVKLFEEAGVKVLFSKYLTREIGFNDVRAFLDIYKLCREQKFDIVHTHSTKPAIIGRTAAKLARIPNVIHTVHGLSFHKFVKFPVWQFYWSCEMVSSFFCDKIILVNEYYYRYFHFFKKKTLTIHNGINFSNIEKNKEIDQTSSTSDKVKVLYVGRLDNQKDPLTLLSAAKLVCEKYNNVVFTIVGDGEMYDMCSEYIHSNNLESQIILKGWQSNVAEFYKSHDIFAMSSIYESFGLIFLEAGFYKLPVVATNVEGIPEVVENNKTGLLCNPRDPEALAINIIKLVDDSALRRNMGEAAYTRVTSLFSSEKMVKEYQKMYENIII